MTLTLTIIGCIILIAVIIYLIPNYYVTAHTYVQTPYYYRSDPWKKPIELYFKDNILTIRTKDLNSKDYYYGINKDNILIWWNYPSFTPVKDKELINYLDHCYKNVLSGSKLGGGWVKSLRTKH